MVHKQERSLLLCCKVLIFFLHIIKVDQTSMNYLFWITCGTYNFCIHLICSIFLCDSSAVRAGLPGCCCFWFTIYKLMPFPLAKSFSWFCGLNKNLIFCLWSVYLPVCWDKWSNCKGQSSVHWKGKERWNGYWSNGKDQSSKWWEVHPRRPWLQEARCFSLAVPYILWCCDSSSFMRLAIHCWMLLMLA